MGTTVLYILEWAFALLLLLAVYKMCFSGTTLHRFNRCYLLAATVISALLPLVAAKLFTPMNYVSINQTEFAHTLQEVTIWGGAPLVQMLPEITVRPSDHIWAFVLIGAWALYVIVLVTGWTRSIVKTKRFLKGKRTHRLGLIRIVSHDEQYGPFSWMNCIVISSAENGFARRASMRHELSHIRLGHYIDLIFLLACTIVNPVCWLIMKEIKIVHEYEADDEVISRYGIIEKDYQRLLIMRTVGAEAYALASSFNLNIKQRIIMMKKAKTQKRRMLYLFAVIPAIGITLMACGTSKSAKTVKEPTAQAQPVEAGQIMTGHVYDEDGKPIAIANITELDDNSRVVAHAMTDANGEYSFRLAGKNHTLSLSYVGFETETVYPIVNTENDFHLIESAHVAQVTCNNSDEINVKFMSFGNMPAIPVKSLKELTGTLKNGKAKRVYLYIGPGTDKDKILAIRKAITKARCSDLISFNSATFDGGTAGAYELPGVLTDDGHLIVNGREISKILVNGKEVDIEQFKNYVDEPLMVVDEMPEFEGGMQALMNYLRTNIIYPKEAHDKNIQGRAMVQFVVEKDGSITEPAVVNDVDPLLGNEALRVVSNMPNWKPGRHQGEPVRVRYTLPVNFRLDAPEPMITNEPDSVFFEDNGVIGEDVPFTVVDEMPQFEGGNVGLMMYLTTQIKYPQQAREKKIQGRVLLQFIVNTDGSISDIKVVKKVDPLLDKEAVRVVSEMPNWKPGKLNGKTVRVTYTLPVNFRLD